MDGRETFSDDADRETCLRLFQRILLDAGVSVLGWCLMTNQVHLVAIPEREDSITVPLRRVHGRYARYYNVWHERIGHLRAALAYVEQNPLRAGMVAAPGDYL